ncbi:MAG: hypothetical protein ACO3IL_01800 [Steroidobacteraceae bacterium]
MLRGVHKDQQKVALPNAAPIPESELAAFQQHAAPLLASLDQLSPAPLLAGRRQAGSDRTKAL